VFHNKLSLRLAIWLVLAALIIQGADIGYRLLVDVPAARQQVMDTIDKAVVSMHPVFRATLSSRNEELGQTSLSSFEQYAAVQNAWLLDENGEAVAAWVRSDFTAADEWQEYRRPIYDGDAIIGSTVMQLDPVPMAKQAMQKVWSLMYFSMAVTLITLLLFYGIVQKIVTRPLKQLADIVEGINTENVTDENLDQLTRVHAEGEVNQLSESFLKLLQSLNQNIASRQQALIGLRKFAETLEEKVDERTEALQAAIAAAEKSGKAKTDFLSVMTHELRTPLNGILGFTALLQKGDVDERTGTLAKNIHDSATKLLTVVNDMIEYVALEGIESFTMTLFSPADAIMSACMNFQKEANLKGIQLESDADVNLLMKGDGQRLSLALRQLLSNAVKFTDEGRVYVSCGQQGDSIILKVEDTGAGIDLNNMQSMLQAFSQGDVGIARANEGIGLGLAIVSRVCQIWGAELEFTNNIPQGTVVTIALPLEIDCMVFDDAEAI